MDEQRKASDIILSLENKIEDLINLNKSMVFSLNTLSNRINDIFNKLNTNAVNTPPQFKIEAPTQLKIESPEITFISKEAQLPIETSPNGFRRTSRAETFENKEKSSNFIKQTINTPNAPKIAVMQRLVDHSGKALSMANIQIMDKNTNELVYKGRTNGMGKYSTMLSPGEYTVSIQKSETLEKPAINKSQDIIVDGSENPLTLQVAIIK